MSALLSRSFSAAKRVLSSTALPPGTSRNYTPGTLKINATRLNDTLHHTCQWGTGHRYGSEPTQTGMSRLTLSDADSQARQWFIDQAPSLGCQSQVDQIGNTFLTRPGQENRDAAPTAMGSHLDTQPSGGRYDGIAGIHAAVEVMRTLQDNNVATRYPLAAINWTNEEGARFPRSIMGSAVWSHDLTLDDALAMTDADGICVRQELKRTGWEGSLPASYRDNPLSAYFELHIEQGPILERLNKSIGVVKGGQAYKWFNLTVHGKESHTGSTPYDARSDALLAAAKIICASNTIGKDLGVLISTGVINSRPQSVNTSSGKVTFSVDVRHPDANMVTRAWDQVWNRAQELARDESDAGTTVTYEQTFQSAAPSFHKDCWSVVRTAGEHLVGADGVHEMYSGAGHDAYSTSKHCPTAMIFIPSRDGVSHNPVEYSSPEQVAQGAQVLLDSIMLYDFQRQQ